MTNTSDFGITPYTDRILPKIRVEYMANIGRHTVIRTEHVRSMTVLYPTTHPYGQYSCPYCPYRPYCRLTVRFCRQVCSKSTLTCRNAPTLRLPCQRPPTDPPAISVAHKLRFRPSYNHRHLFILVSGPSLLRTSTRRSRQRSAAREPDPATICLPSKALTQQHSGTYNYATGCIVAVAGSRPPFDPPLVRRTFQHRTSPDRRSLPSTSAPQLPPHREDPAVRSALHHARLTHIASRVYRPSLSQHSPVSYLPHRQQPLPEQRSVCYP